MKDKKLVIFGCEEFAEIAYEYFTHDSPYEVVAFTADRAYIRKEEFCGLPVIPFENIAKLYPPSSHEIYAAIVYGELNRLRQRIAKKVEDKGYRLASYISSRSFIWHNAKIGKHCFIFEDNTIQPFVEIGDNVVVWSGNHLGHGSKIAANNFLSSHVVVSGNCRIGEHCFIGVNATVGNNVEIGSGSWVSSGAIITRSVPEKSLVKSAKSEAVPLDEEALFKRLKMKPYYQAIAEHYEASLKKFGANHKGMDWPKKEDLDTRFRLMLELCRQQLKVPKLLDLGCGVGLLLDYMARKGLTEKFRYSGIDISPEMIRAAKELHPDHKFTARDIITKPLKPLSYDYIVMNGILTEKLGISQRKMVEFAKNIIAAAFAGAKKGIAFNVMSMHVDWQRDDLFHWPFDEVAGFLTKNISRHIQIRADYGLYEYTVYVYREAR